MTIDIAIGETVANDRNAGDQPAKRIRWVARGTGSLITAFWLFMSMGYAIGESEETWTWESTVIAVLFAISTMGFVIAWRRELVGGVILVVCAVAHSTFALFAAGHNHAFAMLISGGPYLLIGTLFLLSWRRSKANSV